MARTPRSECVWGVGEPRCASERELVSLEKSRATAGSGVRVRVVSLCTRYLDLGGIRVQSSVVRPPIQRAGSHRRTCHNVAATQPTTITRPLRTPSSVAREHRPTVRAQSTAVRRIGDFAPERPAARGDPGWEPNHRASGSRHRGGGSEEGMAAYASRRFGRQTVTPWSTWTHARAGKRRLRGRIDGPAGSGSSSGSWKPSADQLRDPPLRSISKIYKVRRGSGPTSISYGTREKAAMSRSRRAGAAPAKKRGTCIAGRRRRTPAERAPPPSAFPN